ncbi:unnamed protein product (macronuclear) [Paramecium tetraurelia]|uniref:Protein kinase domain-containing protein n=1 Tax=Paramecium tetraurelia TaxID=5888 RepID=A0DQ68_PARTE|nr:uncharacterized protein GSPATT00002585001 [Paramecium tetraurelia]CAK85185.1 unnamed protein product [Paramecium tetraurelia]|eukprot:XP_001452582.1 hypothetical protein (macronuclear) [Paramecium tetraurelia strain d4-2]
MIQPQLMRNRYEDFYETKNQLLGQGAFAQVYLGVKKSNKQKVAVKISNRNLAISQQEKMVLISLSQYRHQNVVQLLDIFDQPEALFIVQEYCSGGTLYEMMSNKTFTEEQIVNIALQVAHGLAFLHSKNIVHRDIKPENILRQIDEQGMEIYKITDFGLSSVKLDRMTTTKVGTAYYVAPEILDKQQYDKSVDVWALGLIIDELLHKTPFYNGLSEEEVFFKIKTTNYIIRDQQYAQATIFDHKKNVIKSLLLNCIQKDPKLRKDLNWIIQTISEYYLQSPSSFEIQQNPNNDRYVFADIQLVQQSPLCEQTQNFQLPTQSNDSQVEECPFHHQPIRYRMPGINDNAVTNACQKCLQIYGIFDQQEFQSYLSQTNFELNSFSVDTYFSQNEIIIEALSYLNQFKFFQEKEKLVQELRSIVIKHHRNLRQEYIQYQDDVKSMNTNAKWINEALKLNLTNPQDMPNKIIHYLISKCNEKKEISVQECRQFIKEQLKLLQQYIDSI